MSFLQSNQLEKIIDEQNGNFTGLEVELAHEIIKLRREQIKIEMAVIELPTFNPDGPGDCGDRQVAAIKALLEQNQQMKLALDKEMVVEQYIRLPNVAEYIKQLKNHYEK